MGKKLLAFSLLLSLLAVLAGCSFGNVNDLLRAPALGQGQGEIQKALAAYLAVEPEYKYPREGSVLSPLLRADLDGDGIDEGIVFYNLPERDNSVYIAVFQQIEGEWIFTTEVKGGPDDVVSADLVDMFGDGTKQLVMGFAGSLSQKSLQMYQFRNGELEPGYTGEYYIYLLDDFTGRGREELAVVSPLGDTGLQLTIIIGSNGAFEKLQENSLTLNERFNDCVAISASEASDGSRYLIVDGILRGNSMLASQVFAFSETETGARFYPKEAETAGQEWVIADSTRTAVGHLLVSRDVNGDDTVETPVRVQDLEIESLTLIEWIDFTGEEPRAKAFGLLDTTNAIFIRLPESWREGIELQTTRAGWQAVRESTDEILLELAELSPGTIAPDNGIYITGSENTYLLLGEGANPAEKSIIGYMLLT